MNIVRWAAVPVFLGVVGLVGVPHVSAQSYPGKPVRFIISRAGESQAGAGPVRLGRQRLDSSSGSRTTEDNGERRSVARALQRHGPSSGCRIERRIVGGDATGVELLPHEKSGRLRALAISSSERFEAAAHLPTVSEAGIPGYEASQWYGVLAPGGTPQPIIRRLNSELVKIVQSAEFRARMLAQATIVSGTSPGEFSAYMKSEIAKWAKVVKFSGARVD